MSSIMMVAAGIPAILMSILMSSTAGTIFLGSAEPAVLVVIPTVIAIAICIAAIMMRGMPIIMTMLRISPTVSYNAFCLSIFT